MNKNDLYNEHKTKFWISIIFLTVEIFIPFILFWVLFTKDFNTQIYKLPYWANIIWILGLILFTNIISFLFYYLNWHKKDQFSYNWSFMGFLISFIISSYFWNWNQFLYRSLLAFAFVIIFLLIGTFLSLWFELLKNKIKKIKSN